MQSPSQDSLGASAAFVYSLLKTTIYEQLYQSVLESVQFYCPVIDIHLCDLLVGNPTSIKL